MRSGGQKARTNPVASDSVTSPKTAVAAPLLQRWEQPAEKDQADEQLAHLDGIKTASQTLMDRARELSTRVPLGLRRRWPGGVGDRVTDFEKASGLLASVGRAIDRVRPDSSTVAELRAVVVDHGRLLNPIRQTLALFEAAYTHHEPAILEQDHRCTGMLDLLNQPEGAPKLGEWTAVATAVRTMDDHGIGVSLLAFQGVLTTKVFDPVDVEAARLLSNAEARKKAIVQYLTDLISTGEVQLTTWAKFYPTAYDLRTGEFGAEWHLSSWLNGKWVFHAHCESIRDPQSGVYLGFRFKPIVGTNHIKMIRERMAAGVQLDLPLSAGVLTLMAAPYQQQFQNRLEDSQFQAALKKSR
jgi:hypothetical protein